MKNFEEIANGSVFVIRSENMVTVPLFCPLCEMPMQTQDDGISFKELGCCYLCNLEYRPKLLEYQVVEDNQLEAQAGRERAFVEIRADEKWSKYRERRVLRSKRTITLR